ncbi:MAG: L,D-transpeptidase family protein [Saprospiraceae bacterium]|nr:L,D-transpeptidase family protein [Saprospiraceae bacterium]
MSRGTPFIRIIFLLAAIQMNLFIHQGCKNSKDNYAIPSDSTVYSKIRFTHFHLDSFEIAKFLNTQCVSNSIVDDLFSFYIRRDFQLAWYTEDGISESALSFIHLVKEYKTIFNDSTLSLFNTDLIIEQFIIDSNSFTKNPELIFQMEIGLTAAYFSYAFKYYKGMEKDPKDLEWYIPRKKKDLGLFLDAMVEGRADLAKYEPINYYYRELKNNLIKLYAKAGKIDSLRILMQHDKNINLEETQDLNLHWFAFLKLLGDIECPDYSFSFELLKTGLEKFQFRHGLVRTGIIDSFTLNAAIKNTNYYLEKIIINLERLRWLPDTIPNEFLLVNIPDFNLFVYHDARLQWSCPVVVGKTIHQTNIFAGDLAYIVFSPYWVVPQSIAIKEILPKLKRNSKYLEQNNMELLSGNKIISSKGIDWSKFKSTIPYTIRQRPGRQNALGKVKFLFPNSYSIYLHDTPAKTYFSQNRRDFSHGCIRVSEPMKLANYLLRKNPKYTSKLLADLSNQEKETWVNLPVPVKVFICYFTAWVDSYGNLHFRDDIYLHDQKLMKELFHK